LSHLLLSSMDASSLTMLVTGPVPAPWQISQRSDYSNKTRPQTPEGLRHTLRFLFLTIAAKLEVKNLTSAHNLRLCLVTCPQRNSRCIHFSRKSEWSGPGDLSCGERSHTGTPDTLKMTSSC
jgi:hypothetical protein